MAEPCLAEHFDRARFSGLGAEHQFPAFRGRMGAADGRGGCVLQSAYRGQVVLHPIVGKGLDQEHGAV